MDDTWLPWLTALSSLQSSSSSSATESVALIYDPDHLMTLGKALNEFVSSTAVTVAGKDCVCV